ncbi:hypothetical protein PoB_000315900 [Plakobranchus ocellatus]|uniref:Uncharacterized protein n=1 Tax=Plakobranchus ocellatus TaxID=259542 RepID=A0AAV3Y355_9GAST|nr:hypothetical protein PoB_000315900 [Plakobranchus ocellatus]
MKLVVGQSVFRRKGPIFAAALFGGGEAEKDCVDAEYCPCRRSRRKGIKNPQQWKASVRKRDREQEDSKLYIDRKGRTILARKLDMEKGCQETSTSPDGHKLLRIPGHHRVCYQCSQVKKKTASGRIIETGFGCTT